MGQGTVSRGMSACTHGGMYSVDHKLVKVDCSSSVNPLGTPPGALRAIVKYAKELSSRYPDPECTELGKSLAQYVGLDPSWIVVANGAVEIIYWFAQAFAGKKVVIPAPTFCEYELASQMAGSTVRFVPMRQFMLDSDSIIREARGADALCLCNPNNPTGLLATREIERIIGNVDKKTAVLLDECFIELVDKTDRNTLVPKLEEFDNVIILRSLTKSFGLAGLRVGYACCRPSSVEKLKMHRIPWNVNGLAQAAGVAALSDSRYLARAKAIIAKERKFLFERLSEMKSFAPLKSDANYFMLHLRDRDSTAFRDALLKKTGVLVRDCSTFTGMDRHHVRIAVKTRSEDLRLVRALEGFDSG
ncbi:MAG: pyridoxal phosphate-dependent aminotransferase [Nitrososphaera sp.]